MNFSQPQSAVAERLLNFRSAPRAPGQLFAGKTALYDSLLAGLQLLKTPTSADTLYVIGDGNDTASRVRFDDVAQRLSSSGVRLFVSLVLAVPGYRSATPEELNGRDSMVELVKRTGGQVNAPFADGFPTKSEEIERFSREMHRFYQAMVQNYRLEIELPARLDESANWELKFSEEGKANWKNARLNYPVQLAACK